MNDKVYLSVGSNLGNKESNIASCATMIDSCVDNKNIRISSFYNSEPLYNQDQPSFINIVIELDTTLSPFEFLDKIHEIEKMLGRKFPRRKNEPRTIDIDIILFGNSFIDTDKLTIPHPSALLRKFVLVPLSELIPEQIFPGTNHKIVDLLNNCPDTSRVSKYLIEKNA